MTSEMQMGAAAAPACISLVTHVLNPAIRSVYERLKREAPADHSVQLILSADDPGQDSAGLSEDQIVRIDRAALFRLPYPQKCQAQDWNMAGNLDLVFLEVRRRMPPFGQYWFVEYDVHWEGRWSVFFEHFRNSPADVLAATVHDIGEAPHKENADQYPVLTVPPGIAWERARAVKAFLPICRLSDAALEALDDAYRKGLGGHYELCVPTIAALAGLTIEDFGGDGRYVRPENIDRFYFARGDTYTHSPGNFVFRPAQHVLRRANTLWHPVKPEGVPLWHPLRAEGGLIKSLVEWLKPWVWRSVVWLWFARRWRPL